MDSTDEKLLNLMKGNARISYEELGKQLGMSRVAAMKRVKKLEKEGVIRGYNTYICWKDEVMGFIDIEASSGKMGDILEYIRSGYDAAQIAMATASDINLVALKVSELSRRGYTFRDVDHRSDFLK